MDIFLVRHGHAGTKERWGGDDRLRPLSERGLEEADALGEVLARFAPARIVSSPLVRCVQTVEPLARRIGRPIETSTRLEPDADQDATSFLHELAAAPAPVVVCTHGETIAALQDDLMARGEIRFDGERAREKGSVWVLRATDGRFTSAKYLPPMVARLAGAPPA